MPQVEGLLDNRTVVPVLQMWTLRLREESLPAQGSEVKVTFGLTQWKSRDPRGVEAAVQ